MSETHSTVNVKNYQFTYPSIAVWQDFNDLNLLESKKKSGSNFLKSKKSLYFSEKRNSRKAKESRKMKRKNQPISQPLGAFIRPSEFTLEYSVLLPSSRAGIRLKPLENAPVPKMDKRNKSKALPNLVDKLKFSVSESAKKVEEEEIKLPPTLSWNPPDIRENTELVKEPTLYLDMNYGSDGDVDLVDIHDLKCKETKRRSMKNKPKRTESMDYTLPEIPRQDIASGTYVVTHSPEPLTPYVCESENVGENVVENMMEKDTEVELLAVAETLPKLNVESGDNVDSKASRNMTKLDRKVTGTKNPSLPFIRASIGQSRAAARYSVKSRYAKPKVQVAKADGMEKKKKNNIEFVVGGGKASNRVKSISLARKSEGKINDKKPSLFEKRKVFAAENSTVLKKQEVALDNLPNTCSEMVSLRCEQVSSEASDSKSEELAEYRSSRDEVKAAQISPSLNLPPVVPAKLEELEIDIDEKRVGTPRLLEYPLRAMKKNDKANFEQKRTVFRKLDVDGDGHLSLFELMKSFPPELTKCQVEYLKMLYQRACSSTFFGLEEFLCVDEMCGTMTAMSGELQLAFSNIDVKDLQARLDEFLLMYVKAYSSSSEAAVFQGFSERAETLSDDTSIKELLTLFKSLNKGIDKGIRKPDFLLMIPFLLEKDVLWENVLK